MKMGMRRKSKEKVIPVVEETVEQKNELLEKDEKEKEEWIWVDGFKGTDKNMCCREYQYELGKQFDMPQDSEVKECQSGFHLCLNLRDVFTHYGIGNENRFFKVKALVRLSEYEQHGEDVGGRWVSLRKDKLAAKSIVFVSELTRDEIFRGTFMENLPDKYKDMAIKVGIRTARNRYMVNTLVEDGYSYPFAEHLVEEGKYDVAHAIGSQSDLSMDIKVFYILNDKNNKEEHYSVKFG